MLSTTISCNTSAQARQKLRAKRPRAVAEKINHGGLDNRTLMGQSAHVFSGVPFLTWEPLPVKTCVRASPMSYQPGKLLGLDGAPERRLLRASQQEPLECQPPFEFSQNSGAPDTVRGGNRSPNPPPTRCSERASFA